MVLSTVDKYAGQSTVDKKFADQSTVYNLDITRGPEFARVIRYMRRIRRLRIKLGKLEPQDLFNVNIFSGGKVLRTKFRVDNFYFVGYSSSEDEHATLWEASSKGGPLFRHSKSLKFPVDYDQVDTLPIGYFSLKSAFDVLLTVADPDADHNRIFVRNAFEVIALMLAESARFDWVFGFVISAIEKSYVCQADVVIPLEIGTLIRKWSKISDVSRTVATTCMELTKEISDFYIVHNIGAFFKLDTETGETFKTAEARGVAARMVIRVAHIRQDSGILSVVSDSKMEEDKKRRTKKAE